MPRHASTTAPSAGRPSPIEPAELHRLFVEYRRTRDPQIRNRIIEAHLHLADHCSRRFRHHSFREDLHQVALLAVVHAAERFDPDHGVSFRTFASSTIDGECKRYLRDRSWNVRPPRSLLELALVVRRQGEELGHALGRAPTVSELADALDISPDDVLQAMEAYRSRYGTSTDAHDADGSPNPAVTRACATSDDGYGAVIDRTVVSAAVAKLPPREQSLIFLRFVERRSQSELATQFGLSQSYVSRFLTTVLGQLRRDIGTT